MIMQRISLYLFLSALFFSTPFFQAMAQEELKPGNTTVIITGQNTYFEGTFNGTIDGENILIPSIIFNTDVEGTFRFKNINTTELVINPGAKVIIELTGGNGKNTISKITNNGTLFLKGNTFLPGIDEQNVTNNAFLIDSTASIKVVGGIAPLISGLIEGSETHNDPVATLTNVAVVGQQELDPNIIQPIDLPETLILICQRQEGLWWNNVDTLHIPVTNRIVFSGHEVKRAGQYRYRLIVEEENARTEIISNTAEVTMTYDVILSAVEGVVTEPSSGTHIVNDSETFTFNLALDPAYSQSIPLATTSKRDTLEADWNGEYSLESVSDSLTIFIEGIALNNISSNTALPSDQIVVHSGQGQIEIFTPEATRLRILTFDGIIHKNLRLTAGNHLITMPAGIYLIQMDRKTVKVIVK